MNCEICALDASGSADAVMWTCVGCPRTFHAACVGITVQRSSLRKKEKKADPNSYLLPCCDSCQHLIDIKLDFTKLVEQQKLLTQQVNDSTEVIHRSALQQEKPKVINEGFERLENLITALKTELSVLDKNCTLAGSVVAIKNHVTSVLDTAIQTSNERIANSLKKVTSELAGDLRNINNGLCQLNQLALDAANTSIMHTNPMLEIDILEELKSLSSKIMACHNPSPSPLPSDPCISLETEMNEMNDKKDDSGWRLLGLRKVWKADWSQYDARQLNRKKQQKAADKAKKRRKQKARNDFNNNNNTHGRNHRSNNNININYNSNHHRSLDHINPSRKNFLDHPNINHPNHQVNNRSRSHFLPPGREHQAAEQFNRPPTSYRPTMQHPHPLGDGPQRNFAGCSSTTSCEACYCRHTCFPRY